MPPEGPELSGRADRARPPLDRRGRRVPADAAAVAAGRQSRSLVVSAAGQSSAARVKHLGLVRNPIDAFVLARLEAAGLAPSPEADRATLIRRVSLDLIGLPPSVGRGRRLSGRHAARRLRAAGRSAAGVAPLRRALGPALARRGPLCRLERLHDRRRPLDLEVSRLGDRRPATATCRSTSSPSSSWPATCCPRATLEQRIATGFHRNTLVNEEGGTDQEQFRVEAVVDRVSTTGAAFLGLTLGCARCHDHKYDPISQREFYQLFAILQQLPTSRRCSVPTEQQAKELPALTAEIEQSEKRLADGRSQRARPPGRMGGPADCPTPSRSRQNRRGTRQGRSGRGRCPCSAGNRFGSTGPRRRMLDLPLSMCRLPSARRWPCPATAQRRTKEDAGRGLSQDRPRARSAATSSWASLKEQPEADQTPSRPRS